MQPRYLRDVFTQVSAQNQGLSFVAIHPAKENIGRPTIDYWIHLLRWWAFRFKMFKSCIPKWNDLHPPTAWAFLGFLEASAFTAAMRFLRTGKTGGSRRDFMGLNHF